MSSLHQEGIAHLLYGINMGGGFVALTGEVGTGKTTLCHCLLGQIPEDVDIAYILNPKLNAVELLASICDELDIEYPENSVSLKVLNDLLNQHLLETHARGKRTVLIIDEAQNLSFDVLEQIRLLTNLETSTSKLLQIILIGQPELRELLNDNQLRQLNQRITARYHLGPLSLKETRTYIQHRIKVSGGRPGIFNSAATKRIYKLTRGIPRLINILCDRSLLGAYSMERQTISRSIVNKAAIEVLPAQTGKSFYAAVGFFSALIIGIPLMAYLGNLLPFQTYTISEQQETLSSLSVPTQQPATSPNVAKQRPVTSPTDPVKIVAKEEQPAPKIKQKFADFIKAPELNLGRALNFALNQWDIETPDNFLAECILVQKTGLRCLPGKSNWTQLINLDRPVILEFTLENQEKRFVLLVGIIQDKVILLADKEYIFPIHDIFPFWKGFFLALWKPPALDFWTLYPGQNSSDIIWLRKHLNQIQGITETVSRPAFYDSNLKKRVKNFQQQQLIDPDGLVGPLTVIHLQNSASDRDFPRLR